MVSKEVGKKFQAILTDPDKQAQLAEIFPPEVMSRLPCFAHGAERYVRKGGVGAELWEIIGDRDDPKKIEEIMKKTGFDVNGVLFEYGSNITLVHAAVDHERPETLEYLLRQPGIDITAHDGKYDEPAIFEAAQKDLRDSLFCFMLLLRHTKLDVNATHRGDSLLMWAEGMCFMILLKIGANVNQLVEDSPVVEDSREFYDVLHFQVAEKGPGYVRQLLEHPELKLNTIDEQGKPQLFHIINEDFFWDDEGNAEAALNVLLKDPRVFLSIRDRDGKSLKDCNLAEKMLSLIRPHEQDRLRRAQEQVNILKDWSMTKEDGTEVFLPQSVLSDYLLPCVADVISPLHELVEDRAQ